MSVNAPSSTATLYSLSADQKKQIVALLKLSQKKAPSVFVALEQIVRTDGWIRLSASGELTKEKVSAYRARNLNSVAKGLKNLSRDLSKIDPLVLAHIDDQFSFFQFEMSHQRNHSMTSQRTVLPLRELITKLQKWTEYSAVTIKPKRGSGYLTRFLNELDEFWLLHDGRSRRINQTKLCKLTIILLGIDADAARKQVARWKNPKKKADKSKV